MEPVIFVPAPVHQDAIDLMRRDHAVRLGYGSNATGWEDALSHANGLLLRGAVGLSDKEMSRAPHLNVVARHGVGVENIDIHAAEERNIVVLNTPHANTEAVAEFTLAVMLALVRRIPDCDRLVRAGGFGRRDEMLGINLRGKTLGLLGFGRISGSVAEKAAAFGMNVSAYDPFVPEAQFREADVAKVEEIGTLLKTADIVSVHVPLSAHTKSLIGRKELAMMKQTSYLLQLSRGGVVDESALVDALKRGQLRGAALDVFETEPPGKDAPILHVPNVLVTPHVGAHTEESFRNMAVHAAEGIISVLAGNPLVHAAIVKPT